MALGPAATLVSITGEPPGVAREPPGGFGSLRVVLGAISTVYADYKVRPQPLLESLLC